MTKPEAEAANLADILMAGARLRRNLLDSLERLEPFLPLSAPSIGELDRAGAVETDAFLLRFTNMTTLVQDQLLRAILVAEREPLEGRSRRDALNIAEKIGALDKAAAFNAITEARNRVAHVYPNRPDRQAEVINKTAAAVPTLVAVFDGFARFATERGLLPLAP